MADVVAAIDQVSIYMTHSEVLRILIDWLAFLDSPTMSIKHSCNLDFYNLRPTRFKHPFFFFISGLNTLSVTHTQTLVQS